jgi:hypothetical protein
MSEESAEREDVRSEGKAAGPAEKPGGGAEGSRNYRRAKRQSDAETVAEPDFQTFLAGLYTQTLVSLGAVENPATGERKSDMSQAQYLIDTLGMIKEKTEGNLDQQEQQYLLSLLQDLRMRYVRSVETAQKEDAEEATEAANQEQ